MPILLVLCANKKTDGQSAEEYEFAHLLTAKRVLSPFDAVSAHRSRFSHSSTPTPKILRGAMGILHLTPNLGTEACGMRLSDLAME